MNMWGMRYEDTPEDEALMEAVAEQLAIERYAASHGIPVVEAARLWAAAKDRAAAQAEAEAQFEAEAEGGAGA